jgi:pimeloyl-ACP methyl ester carboxylesterase
MPDLLYKELAKTFNTAGMVTLRYDRRGYGASTLSGKKVSYDDVVTDAQDAVKFLMARKEVGKSAVAVVGHDVGGPIALHVAGAEPRVKSVVLISSPGRPLVEPLAESFATVPNAGSAAKLRTIVSGLIAGDRLPGVTEIPPEQQPILGQGEEALLRGMFAVDPVSEAAKVKVPVLAVVSSVSTGVKRIDADLIAQAVGPTAEVMEVTSGPTLRVPLPDRPPVEFVAGNDSTHVFGARVVDPEPRDQASVDKVAQWLATKLAAANR